MNNISDFIRNNNKKFDLEKFLTGSGAEGAAILITDKQIVIGDSSNYDEGWVHEYILRGMYSAIYNSDIAINECDYTFGDEIIEDGNIYMTAVFGGMKTVLVFMPNTITSNQYKLLEKFNNKVKEIYNNNEESFFGSPIIFNSMEAGLSINNMDKILTSYKNRIKDVGRKEEVIIGDTIDSFDIANNIKTR